MDNQQRGIIHWNWEMKRYKFDEACCMEEFAFYTHAGRALSCAINSLRRLSTPCLSTIGLNSRQTRGTIFEQLPLEDSPTVSSVKKQ
jgi:hypothetical protein